MLLIKSETPKQLPLISVFLLAYKHGKFIRQAITSVLAQVTDFPYEIVIGDDCSPDDTLAIIREFETANPSIIRVLTSEKNLGAQPNAIRILDNCKGKYIATLEGDDYWLDPYKLQKQATFMEANPSFAICFTNTKVEFFDTDDVSYVLNQNLEKDVFTIDDLIAEKEIWFMGTATLFYKASFALPLPPWFYKTKSGDIPMIMLAARNGDIKFLPDVTAVYRRHSEGASNTDGKNDARFLENRIMMYTNLNRDTGYKFHDRFKKNLGGWYYLLLNSYQYENSYFKKLGIAVKYMSLMYPNIPNLKLVIRDHVVPKFVLEFSRFLKSIFR
jgi:glycosyltransferase involved in cell wall biosynthesis